MMKIVHDTHGILGVFLETCFHDRHGYANVAYPPYRTLWSMECPQMERILHSALTLTLNHISSNLLALEFAPFQLAPAEAAQSLNSKATLFRSAEQAAMEGDSDTEDFSMSAA